MTLSRAKALSPILAASIALSSSSLHGDLIHRWSFDETAGAAPNGSTFSDSVGNAHGRVRGNGAVFTGSGLNLPGGDSLGGTAAYGDLPNGIISSLNDATIEGWVTVDSAGGGNWTRFFDFGSTQGGGEITGPGNTNGGGTQGLDYIFLSAARGGNYSQQRVEIRNEDPGGGGISTFDTNVATAFGQPIHFVVTVEDLGESSRINYWRDGVHQTVNQTSATTLSEINDVNNWLGRSTWINDGTLDGTFDEFRIYDETIDAEAVASSFAAGPDALSGGPTINSFSVAPTSILEGQNVELSWNVSDADSLSIDGGVGVVGGVTGSVQVAPITGTTFTLTASNGEGMRTAQVVVTVDPGVPSAEAQALSTAQDTPLPITLTGRDPNSFPEPLSFLIERNPAHGRLTGSPPSLIYEPEPGFSGKDSFEFKVNDGNHDSNVAMVAIAVVAPPSAPVDIVLSTGEIRSSTGPGQFVGLLSSADPNPEDTHSYAFAVGDGDAHNGLFTLSENLLLSAHDFSDLIGASFSIRVRTTDDTGRFYEEKFLLTVVEERDEIVINEIHYDPPENAVPAEFIELHNPGLSDVDLSGWTISGGLSFTFPASTSIPAGGYLVVAQDPPTLQALYGVNSLGPFTGRLDGESDEVNLRDAAGQIVDEVDYRARFPWPITASGEGSSMELIDPSLDNNLGSSWRSSVAPGAGPGDTPVTYIAPGLASWRYRKGTSEASNPVSAWRDIGFVEDGSWVTGRAPIGYGDSDDATVLDDMRNQYSTVYFRHQFTVEPGKIPRAMTLRVYIDDGAVVWINGTEVARPFVSPGQIPHDATGPDHEAGWAVVELKNPAAYLVEGTNVLAIHGINRSLGSSDFSFDAELRTGSSPVTGLSGVPTPGAVNSTLVANAPPNIRQVEHTPREPTSSEQVVITAKVSDPDGVGAVDLHYQVVLPGAFIPSRLALSASQILSDPDQERPLNPVFESPANWTTVAMRDDGTGGDATGGDRVFSVTLPAQGHRVLVRYRITVEDLRGAAVRTPFSDDEALNFACFVYDGVPDYTASERSVHPSGAGHVWTKEALTTIPVYHLLMRTQDYKSLMAYSGSEQFPNNDSTNTLAARRYYNWEGALVYDGVVYDHMRVRLRGGNSRYGDFDGRFPRGKRHMKFKFNRGSYFQARDQEGKKYPVKWRIFNVNRMFGTKGGNNWGLPEEVTAILWRALGVPAQHSHWYHFRVIDHAEEHDQYDGDFHGLFLSQERYDVRFLETHELEKGNLYKLSDWLFDAERQRRYQALGMPTDGSEFDNIRWNLHGAQNTAWLRQHVNYEKWYHYSAVLEAVRHYDMFPEPTGRHRLKNLVWYFAPDPGNPHGVCWFMPYDWDASWGPTFNNGWDQANNALYGHVTINGGYVDKPQMKLEHRNVIRAFRDLVWQPDQVEGLIEHRSAVIRAFEGADRDRWRNAPPDSGDNVHGTANDDTLLSKSSSMKSFAFAGGRATHLDNLGNAGGDAGAIPNTPVIRYRGVSGYPTDGLVFRTTPFADPQGAGTFQAMEWRVAEVTDPAAPAYDPQEAFKLEWKAAWESGELRVFSNQAAIPGSVLRVGRTYRARVRFQDTSDRWGHWSVPHEFTTTEPSVLGELQGNLMINELMYHPAPVTPGEVVAGFEESDFEYAELVNISETLSLNLSEVRFTKGIDFDFGAGTIQSLAPGGRVLVVRNQAAFEMRHGPGLPVAGEWQAGDNLSNGGERLKLSHGAGTAIHDFVYSDLVPWPEAPDGQGPSLTLVDPAGGPDHALGESWRASFAAGGTPGWGESGQSVADWLAARGENDPLALFSGTDLPNLVAFALGADLLADPVQAFPTVNIMQDAGEDYFALTYRRRIGAVGVSVEVETSHDLSNWQSGDGFTVAVGTPVPNGDGSESITVRCALPTDQRVRGFLRLRVMTR